MDGYSGLELRKETAIRHIDLEMSTFILPLKPRESLSSLRKRKIRKGPSTEETNNIAGTCKETGKEQLEQQAKI